MRTSREKLLKNLAKAWASGTQSSWRSPEESRLIRMFAWQWRLGRGPECGNKAMARWLGVDEKYIRHLRKKLPLDGAAFDREVARNGAPTLEALRAARQKTRSMRARGLVRIQPRWKEIAVPGYESPRSIPTKPNNCSLVLNGMTPLTPPSKTPKPRLPKQRRRNYLRSREVALENIKKAQEKWKPPKRWRSPEESHLLRMFIWQWLLGRGPHCSKHALARWLSFNRFYISILKKKLPMDEAAYLREVARTGVPTLEALERARQKSRWMRDENLLRTQRPLKTVKCEWNGMVHYEMIPTKPSNGTLVLDGVTALEPPRGKIGSQIGNRAAPPAPDEFTTRMWQLRMREERQKKVKPVMPRRWVGRR